MKRIQLLITCLCISFSSFGQIPSVINRSNQDYGFGGLLWTDYEPVPADSLDFELARVYYDFTYNGEKVISGIWLLQVGANTTRFLNERRYKADSVQRVNPRKVSSINNYNENGDLFHFFDSYFISNDKCRFICRFGLDDIMYEETIPPISWELQDSVANICGYLCHSAIGSFRGRTYHVFYAEDIPVSSGPWKLSGLPGLILYASVDDEKFIFRAKQVIPNTGMPIIWPKYPYIKVNRNQYTKMLIQMQQNYHTAYATHLTRNPQIRVSNNQGVVQPDLSWIEHLEKE
jgi:GLPGLI family protein